MLVPSPGEESLASRSATSMVVALALSAALMLCDAAQGNVSGVGQFSPDPLVDGAQVEVGLNAYGSIRVDNGSTFSSESFVLGGDRSGFGLATVTGAGSLWSVNRGSVGPDGYGRLEILSGGVVQSSDQGPFELGGSSPEGRGDVVVSGSNSALHVAGPFRVGAQNSAATLRISDGAMVNAVGFETRIGSGGRVALEHGLFRTRGLQNDGIIGGSGEIEMDIFNNGRIEVLSGQALRISSGQFGNGSENEGEIMVDGGKLEFQTHLRNDGSGQDRGTISLRNAEFRTGLVNEGNEGQLSNRGNLTTFGGETHVHGVIDNESNGVISITNQSLAVFHDFVRTQSNSTIGVSPNSTALFLKGLDMNGGTLLADIAGLDGFGHVEVIGEVQLSGALQVNLLGGFEPQLGDSFELLSATNGISGHLNVWPYSDLSEGLEWELEVAANRLMLNVVAVPTPLFGDYNFDGSVDAADYTVWRDAVQSGNLAADGDDSGTIDGGDYDVWKANSGTTVAGAAAVAQVPEPSIGLLVASAMIFLAATRRAVAD